MTKTDLCPDPQTLNRYLLGTLVGPVRDSLDEHLMSCEQCINNAETVAVEDEFTKLMLGATPPEGNNQEAVQQLIERIKQARQQLDTVRVGETLPGTPVKPSDVDPASAGLAVSLDFLAAAQAPDELGRLGAITAFWK